MSNYLAIATVTATLQKLLQSAIQGDVEGARVTTVRPDNLGSGAPESGVNVFLYQVTPNPVWANNVLPARQRRAEVVVKSQAPLDLFYLISFYGNDVELEPQRLLGSTIRTLEDKSVLTGRMIRDTIGDGSYPFLVTSDLAEQGEQIRIDSLTFELDELSNLWGTFFQAPYLLSIAYKVTVVLIDGEEPAAMPLPVRDRLLSAAPTDLRPYIESVISHRGRYEPIVTSSTLLINGKYLAYTNAQVKIAGQLITPQRISEKQAVLPLNSVVRDSLRAGLQSVQIIHPRPQRQSLFSGPKPPPEETPPPPPSGASEPTPPPIKTVESNVVGFILRPSIQSVTLDNIRGSEDDPRSGDVTVELDVLVGREQRFILVLNQQATGENEVSEYLFEAPQRAEVSRQVTVTVRDISPGGYLVRVMIDGAESPLQVDTNENSPTFRQYIAPSLIVP
ncbi:DUF4255 domain-containing protein [Spirulina subsalsa]|uniref:DUF4255 domain-containing protein n=1 Tax=Spirulina subsalsa TaxID=54311 RepID=UPI0003139059|nr:DUF4255 domain-containing protein [Spirulina subsalsa]